MASKNNSGGLIGILVAVIVTVIGVIVTIITTLFKSFNNSAKRKRETEKSSGLNIEYTGGSINPADSTFSSYVAGAQYHCEAADLTFFRGVAAPDPTNEYDRLAVAIYRENGPLLGFVPKSDLSEFSEWSGGRNIPCCGYISEDPDGRIHSNVKFIFPYTPDFVSQQISDYEKWWKENKK